ncbi:hypothetical protein T02_2839 [Trichinella nativa]|uniref:Uncharacterized protein n=1 Tax=Trichinella nativa TaxID=6335 RepID=A0A0V1L8H6_9BILA|nr:hypothetical protein T02_2839 [Trichinella nativa]
MCRSIANMTSHSIKSTSKSKIFQSSIACLEEEMFLSNGNRFKYFAIACHLELVIIKCVINFFHLSGACFVVVLGLADAGLPACVFIRFGSAISVLLCSFRLLLHVTTEGIIIQISFYFFASSFACEELLSAKFTVSFVLLLRLDRCPPS